MLNEENIIKEGPANLQRGLETVGGKIYLTNKRLVFEPHMINIQQENTSINLEDITGIVKMWTKFLNIFPLFPNSVSVKTKDGSEFNFVVPSRDTWIAAIQGNKNF